jgi:hypothetical protein
MVAEEGEVLLEIGQIRLVIRNSKYDYIVGTCLPMRYYGPM